MPRHPLPPGTAGQIKAYKVKPGQWRARCRYRDYTGGMHYAERSGRTKDDAVYRLREAIRDWSGVRLDRRSFMNEVVDKWLAHVDQQAERGDLAKGTARLYRLRANKWIKPGIGQLRVYEVNTVVINKMLAEVSEKSSTQNAGQVKSSLNLIFTYAIENGAAEVNPARDAVRLPKPKKRKTPTALTDDEIKKLLEQLDTDEVALKWDLGTLVRFGLGTGLRLGEALSLRWSNIDLAAKTVRVDRGRPDSDRGKTDAATRTVPLPDWCVELLKAKPQGGPDDPVFPHYLTGGFMNTQSIDTVILKFRKRHDWPETFVFHTLRKTVATALDKAGLTAREIADILGHVRPSMTQDVYMGRAQVSRAAGALDRAFGPVQKTRRPQGGICGIL